MADKHYTGGCHCKHVRYEVTADLDKTIQCNCSICSARGFLFTFVPATKFKQLSGDDQREYLFNKKKIHHLFCPQCGVESFATGQDKNGDKTYAINVRCLDDVDLTTLGPQPFDGRSM